VLLGFHDADLSVRNRFGITGLGSEVSLNVVQQRLGHAEPLASPIDADAVGAEAKQIAKRM
jgi:hypothetical protein